MFGRSGNPCTECHLWVCRCDEKPALTAPVVECETDEPQRTAEDVEADIRVLMAKHASISKRGWQTARDRDILHMRIDRLYDEYAAMLQIEDMTRGWDCSDLPR
jgi:hypothetical protein